MSTAELFDWGLVVMAVWALLTVVIVTRINAPYGRHARPGWGPTMPARWGWVVFEAPAVVLFAVVFFAGPHAMEAGPLALFVMWQVHYVHRDLIWPFRIRAAGKRIPLMIVGAALAFQVLNSWLNATWLSTLGSYPAEWLTDPRFLAGAALFAVGMAINLHADHVLFTLRRPGERGYKIPHGGAYRWVSCPNYLGEMLEWCGFALASWSLPGLAFALYTVANLAPRAAANHRWYRERFPEYPPERRRLIPGVW